MVKQRVLIARLIEKIRKNPDLAKTLGFEIANEGNEENSVIVQNQSTSGKNS